MKSVINEELLVNSIKKIEMYQVEEKKQLSNLRQYLNTIEYNYDSTNKKKITNAIFEINKKFKTIKDIHFNNTYVMKKTINKYKNVTKQVERKFSNIGR